MAKGLWGGAGERAPEAMFEEVVAQFEKVVVELLEKEDATEAFQEVVMLLGYDYGALDLEDEGAIAKLRGAVERHLVVVMRRMGVADDYRGSDSVLGAVGDFWLGFVGWWAQQLVGACNASEGGEGARGGGSGVGPGEAPGLPTLLFFLSISDAAQHPVPPFREHEEHRVGGAYVGGDGEGWGAGLGRDCGGCDDDDDGFGYDDAGEFLDDSGGEVWGGDY